MKKENEANKLQILQNGILVEDSMVVDVLMASLTEQQKDAIYRKEWHKHVCEDIRTYLKDNSDDDQEPVTLTDDQISYAADRYVYDGEYDCTQDYWENIQGVVDMARTYCEP